MSNDRHLMRRMWQTDRTLHAPMSRLETLAEGTTP
nr:MAG TPA: hypothetical protein [Caudoviricetes sp.]